MTPEGEGPRLPRLPCGHWKESRRDKSREAWGMSMVAVGADVGGGWGTWAGGPGFALEVDVERRNEGVSRTEGGNVRKETD